MPSSAASPQDAAPSCWAPEPGIPYLLALDVDGTLVHHDGTMSEVVRQALQEVVRAGHHVVIATGRSKGATLPVVETAQVDRGFAVASNGGVTLELSAQSEPGYQVLETVTFRPARALEALRDRVPGAKFALETAEGGFYSTEWFRDQSFGMEPEVVSFQELVEMEAVRVVVLSTQVDMDTFTQAVQGAGLHGVAYAVGWTPWLDIAAQGVSKATALEQVRRRLGVDPAHTVAVGDGHNDTEMLQWAARGFAMGQAPQEVLEAADEVTGSVAQDGAAAVLHRMLD